MVDTIKNIFLWKNQRKTEMFFFDYFNIICNIFDIKRKFILYTFWKGSSYFAKSDNGMKILLKHV